MLLQYNIPRLARPRRSKYQPLANPPPTDCPSPGDRPTAPPAGAARVPFPFLQPFGLPPFGAAGPPCSFGALRGLVCKIKEADLVSFCTLTSGNLSQKGPAASNLPQNFLVFAHNRVKCHFCLAKVKVRILFRSLVICSLLAKCVFQRGYSVLSFAQCPVSFA